MSRFQRILKYFATERGRITTMYCVAAVGCGVFVSRWAPHSLAIDYYREFATCYKFGIEKQLSDKIHLRFEKALKMVPNMDELERTRYKLFCVFGMDPFHAGSYHSLYGSIIGIPDNFNYEKPSDIPKRDIVLAGQQTVSWSSEAGQTLEKSLIFSDDEQLFAILREILYCRTWQWPLNCAYPTATVIATYALAHTLNNKLQLFARPLSLRLTMYFLVGVFMIGNYCFATDATQNYYDTFVDKQMAAMGEGMINAGIKFYDKVLQRNMALRSLTGDFSVYTSLGNVNYLLRQKSMPITTRKEFFEKQLAKLQNTKEEEK